ncbi:major tail tube [Citromicrobium phage vB_CbaS-RXM]|nr:major tail tube [Citromicrobium phage vB_CbaS-RXM]
MTTRKLLADSNRAAIREIVESNDDWGTTPVNGITRAVRFTSSSIAVSKATAKSDEIRSDRMVSSIIETGASSGGDLNFEFSAGNQDGAMQRVLQGAWTRPMTFDVFRGETVSIAANNQIAIAGPDKSAYFVVGRRVRTSGFVQPQNNDYATISAVAFANGVTTITVEGTPFVAETGSAKGAVRDANDVLVLKNTGIRFGQTARTIDSNGTDAFAALVAAKQLQFGQVIFVEGVGYETGEIDLTALAADEAVTISDGVDALTFTNGVEFTDAATLATAINEARLDDLLYATATVAGDVVTVTNLRKAGGEIATEAAGLAVTDFAGGDVDFGGFYTVFSATDDAIIVDRDLPATDAGLSVTIKGSMLRNPGDDTEIVPQSITIETTFTDVGQNFISDGLRDGGFELSVSAESIITGTIKREGRETNRRTRKLNKAPYTVLDAPATENVSATANVGALRAGGEVLSTAIKSITLAVDGALRKQTAVGNKFPVGIAAGRLTIGVTVEAYFADGSNYDAFINHDTRDLIFPIIDPEQNTYYFTVPSFKITSDPIAPGGIDQDVMETMEGDAFRDATRNCMLQIDRFSSTVPVGA